MSYLYEGKLREKAEKFIVVLVDKGFEAEITMVRDYLIKIFISRENIEYGDLIIDYKAKKDTYSLRIQELKDKSIEDEIFDLWETIKYQSIKHPDGMDKHSGGIGEHQDDMDIEHSGYNIYVDGSYLDGKIGYGAVILKNNTVIKEIYGQVTDPVFSGSRQVGGEIQAVMQVLKWCNDNDIKKVTIFYDFKNLKKWATGEFAANIPMTIAYRKYVNNTFIDIEWIKVEGHSGDKWNEKADELAKKGAELLVSY